MKVRLFLVLLLSSMIILQVEAQRRTTSVRGYYRKDGTYVRPHTRSYDAGSNYYSNTYVQPDAQKKQFDSTAIHPSSLNISTVGRKEYISTTKKSYYDKGEKIYPSTLLLSDDETPASNTDTSKKSSVDGVLIYVSVLRYNGKTIDICPISRDYYGNWDFEKVQHNFSKQLISPAEALQLVGEYDWSIMGEIIKRDFSYEGFTKKGLPVYLTKTIEALSLK